MAAIIAAIAATLGTSMVSAATKFTDNSDVTIFVSVQGFHLIWPPLAMPPRGACNVLATLRLDWGSRGRVWDLLLARQ